MSKDRIIAIDAGSIFTPLKTFSPGRILIEGSSIGEVGGLGVALAELDKQPAHAFIFEKFFDRGGIGFEVVGEECAE